MSAFSSWGDAVIDIFYTCGWREVKIQELTKNCLLLVTELMMDGSFHLRSDTLTDFPVQTMSSALLGARHFPYFEEERCK